MLAIVNNSTVVSDAELVKVTRAIQIQLDEHWAPLWRSSIYCVAVVKGHKPPAGCWTIVIKDDTPEEGYLGWHEETAGYPAGVVFARSDQKAGLSWSVTCSHECVEMIADPYGYGTVLRQTGPNTADLVALEVCDPVQDEAQSYLIGSVRVSNFVYPTWFSDAPLAPGGKYDHLGRLTAPFTIAPGGYMAYLPVTLAGDWQERDGAGKTAPADANDRVARRFQPRASWPAQ